MGHPWGIKPYHNILQAKSIPTFIDLLLTYFFASSHNPHISVGFMTFVTSNQLTLSKNLATQNPLSGHFLTIWPSIIPINSSGDIFRSQRAWEMILLFSSSKCLSSIADTPRLQAIMLDFMTAGRGSQGMAAIVVYVLKASLSSLLC